MPRKHILTWQPGTGDRAGRWRKKYKGRRYYFAGGRGKSDRDAYDAALAAWEKKKLQIDAEAPKPHQADYERAIAEWELVLAWCRKHQENEMADMAMAKLDQLRKGLSATKPKPLGVEDTFEGQFDRSVRYPGLDEAMAQLGATVEESVSSGEDPYGHLSAHQEHAAAVRKFAEMNRRPSNGTGIQTYVAPAQLDLSGSDSLAVEREVWHDRLEVMQRSAASPDKTVKGHVETFLADKKVAAAAGLLTSGRVNKLQVQLTHFQSWLGQETPVAEIKGSTLIDYRAELLKAVEGGTWSRTTANERLGTVKSFVWWLWQADAIPALPRVLDGKSKVLEIGKSRSPIVVFTKQEIRSLLKKASDRTKLYILLMLNCGTTQKDIADIQFPEVDWRAGRITRKRSKTRQYESVPEVSYLLWPETLGLLRRERNSAGTGRVLLNESGRPLWYEELGEDGKYKKNDNIRNAFERLRRKLKINKSLLSLKKTSASLIRGHKHFKGLEDLFLGHAPQRLSDRHYAKEPQNLLNEAITWLREEYRIEDCGIV